MPVMTGGDVVVKALADQGIRKVFSCPGGQFLPIYDALREHPDTELIVPRHEGAAALMACGYSLATGKPASVMTTVGAGVVYEASGLLLAWRERLPVISIAPQVQSYRMKPIQESLQACDQDEIFRTFTKFRAILYHYDRMPDLIARSIRMACAPEPGPIHLDVPVDVIFEYKKLRGKSMKKVFPSGLTRYDGEVHPDPGATSKAAEAIMSSIRPVVLAGRGVERARAGIELGELCEMASMKAIVSTAAFSCLPALANSGLGLAVDWSDEEGLSILANADLLVLIEADEETARLASALMSRSPSIKVVQSAALSASVGSVVPVEHSLVGTPSSVLSGMAREASGKRHDRDTEWMETLSGRASSLYDDRPEKLSGPRETNMAAAMKAVSEYAGSEDFVVCDGPLVCSVAARALRLKTPHRSLLIPGDEIPGAGLPLSHGIKAALPDSNVFLFSDTDRMKRHHRELQTQARYGLGVSTFLFQAAETRPDHEVDFSHLSRSLGVKSEKMMDSSEELSSHKLEEAVSDKRGFVFDLSEGL